VITSEEVGRSSGVRPKNPYVGPRAILAGEPLYARDRETRELANLLVAERVVLLHAPSGAGKTSLIQAGLTPLLQQRRFRPTIPLRVKTPAPPDGHVHNRYIYSVALDLLGGQRDPKQLAELPFGEVIEQTAREAGEGFLVLIFDQFEEILTVDPTDWENQATFFRELGRALAGGHVWTLFSMREDYIGGLDRFLRYLPGHLNATYRLDFLDRSAAKAAIQLPASEQGIQFTDEAAIDLVRRLAVVKVQRPCHGVADVEAPYVQPFQLQVVSRRLWKSVSREKRDDFRAIELEDVERHSDISAAFRHYYAGAVADVAKQTGVTEMAIRQWFEAQLITVEGFRSQTVTAPASGEVEPADVLRALQDTYLVRGDTRAGSTWYELAHDMLIEPILDDNRKWRRRRLEPWQLAAREWAADRQMGRLLHGSELRDVHRRADTSDLEPLEREFLLESDRVERERGLLIRMRGVVGVVGFLALLELAAIVVLVILLLSRRATL
jgi:hypothetical protein